MKQRVIAGVGIFVGILVFSLVAPKWMLALALGVLMSIGAYELLERTGLVRERNFQIGVAKSGKCNP